MNRITARLFLGSMQARRPELLREAGITHVLAIQLPDEYRTLLSLPPGMVEEVVSMADDDAVCIHAFLPHCVAWLDETFAESPDAVVLLHCTHGLSRSPVVAMAYLMAHAGMTFDEAHAHVTKCRPCISPRASLLQQLRT